MKGLTGTQQKNIHGLEFIKAGEASKCTTNTQGVVFSIDNKYQDETGIVYLFMHKDDIVYIGVTKGRIIDRMRMYKLNNGSTNRRMRNNLQKDKSYEIYIHKAAEISIGDLKTTNELTVEKCLIETLKPKYNISRS